jgi:hypothetical protein
MQDQLHKVFHRQASDFSKRKVPLRAVRRRGHAESVLCHHLQPSQPTRGHQPVPQIPQAQSAAQRATTPTYSSALQQIAARSIRRSWWRRPVAGSWPARLVGASAAGMVRSGTRCKRLGGGSELLIFVRRTTHSHDLLSSLAHGRRASLCQNRRSRLRDLSSGRRRHQPA